jgi:hypothetical protein
VKCAIVQPSYVPWRGYFHQIEKSDVFVFYDDVQYDKHGWRNRNRIKTANGPTWLTIPVAHKGNVSLGKRIDEVAIVWDEDWRRKHLLTLRQAYGKAPHFGRYAEMIEGFFAGHPDRLVDFTIETTVALARSLGLERRFVRSSTLDVPGTRTERLVGILRRLGADHYISGPSARAYLEEEALARAGIVLEYMTYDYPEYEQLYPPYDAQVSVLDLLFMQGPDAPAFIWGR